MTLRKTVFVALVLSLMAAGAYGSSTQRWELDSFEDFEKGQADGVEISSTGELRPSGSLEVTSVDADAVWSMAFAGNVIYLGTGNKGEIFRFKGGKAEKIVSTEHVAISALAYDNGRLYYAGIPGAALYVYEGGSEKKLADLEMDYVWDILIDGSDILVAGGPDGKIMRLSRSGKVKATVETGEEHVMCLMKGGDGEIYAGTSGEGLILRLTGGDDYIVVHDFEEKEVKALGWAGRLVAAVNSEARGRAPRGPSAKIWAREAPEDDDKGDNGEKGDEQAPEQQIVIKRRPAPGGSGRVSGAVYAITDAGSSRLLVELPKRAAVDLVVSGGEVFVSTDQEGKVYRTAADGSGYGIAYDLEAAQVLSLLADRDGIEYLGAGSPAGVAQVKRKITKEPAYTSEVMDAKFPARWGVMDVLSDGGPVTVKTRSGNVKDPDKGWSDWQAVGLMKDKVKSPDARYMQVKVKWPLGSDAVLDTITLPYAVYNQPHYVEEVKVESPNGNDGKASSRKRRAKRGKDDESGPGEHKTERQITWKVTNPDKDELEYELYFQPRGSDKWIRMDTPEPVTEEKFKWETESIPDGHYRVKVVASDSPDNAPEEAFSAEFVSRPVLVDNRSPQIKGLRVSRGSVSGKAVDETSAISGVQYSIDGKEWVTVGPEDGVFDSNTEDFKFDLPGDLAEGPHVLSVRAWDRALNIGAGQEIFEK